MEESDIATLAMVLVQLTGDESVLEDIAPFIRGPWDYAVSLPENESDDIRARLIETMQAYAHDGRDLPPPPSNDQLQKMMSVCVGETVSDEYAPMMLEELAFHDIDPKGVSWRKKPAARTLENFHVVVIGAGMSGILTAIKLKQAGIPFTVIEKNDTVGGTWYENRYPLRRRYAQPFLFIFVRAKPRMDAFLLETGQPVRLSRRLRRQVRLASGYPLRHRSRKRAFR